MLEEKIRAKYEIAEPRASARGRQVAAVKVHVIGFAKLIGDLIDGLLKVMVFFAVAALIATAIIYAFTRCVRSTASCSLCSLIAVVWQLGWWRCWASGSIRSRCSCRSWSSRSACPTARRR